MTTKKNEAPVIPAEIIEYLDRVFPWSSIKPDWPPAQIYTHLGARQVIRHLISVYKAQNDVQEDLMGSIINKENIHFN